MTVKINQIKFFHFYVLDTFFCNSVVFISHFSNSLVYTFEISTKLPKTDRESWCCLEREFQHTFPCSKWDFNDKFYKLSIYHWKTCFNVYGFKSIYLSIWKIWMKSLDVTILFPVAFLYQPILLRYVYWLVLMACQLVWCYFMSTYQGRAYILRLYLYFLWTFFNIFQRLKDRMYSYLKQIICKQIYLTHK